MDASIKKLTQDEHEVWTHVFLGRLLSGSPVIEDSAADPYATRAVDAAKLANAGISAMRDNHPGILAPDELEAAFGLRE